MKKAIILEFNELCPDLMDQFIADGLLPNFSRLKSESDHVIVTDTSDAELQPWVQWVTFHTGVPQAVHKIFSLDEGHNVNFPYIWDDLHDIGLGTFVFGSMNGNYKAPGVEFMPDFWSSKLFATNEKLAKLHKFFSQSVQEHANPFQRYSLKEIFSIVGLLVGSGLKLRTLLKIASHLFLELLNGGKTRWKRALLFEKIGWDIFLNLWKNCDKEVGVYFGNSTAHLQHRYWRYLEIDKFQYKPSSKAVSNYAGTILAGYRNMDLMVGEILSDEQFSDAAIVLVSALSQQANSEYFKSKPRVAYRAINFDKLFSWLGVSEYYSVDPLMTHLAWVEFDSTETAAAAFHIMADSKVLGRPLFEMEVHGERIKFWCGLNERVGDSELLFNSNGDSARLGDLFAEVGESLLDGTHSPEGILWISKNRSRSACHSVASSSALEDCKSLIVSEIV